MRLCGSFSVFFIILVLCQAGKKGEKLKKFKARGRNNLNITKVFEEKGRLWLYKQTQCNIFYFPEKTDSPVEFVQKCIFLKTINISNTDVYFREMMDVNGDKVEILYRGDFIPEEEGAPKSMNVTDLSVNDTSPFEVMELGYSNQGCYVFFLTRLHEDDEEDDSSGRRNCEMYIRNHKPPGPKCENFFKTNCGEQFYEPYEESCKIKKNIKVARKNSE
uniref:Lipocalin-2 1 n=1 Tax=Amblyomma cajennense TaxID=34607 RepID=A0A023FUB0_AMBCJ